jgi:hypothetical protein
LKQFFKSISFLSSLILFSIIGKNAALAQAKNAVILDRFRVEFSDKKGNTFTLARPWEFLSPRALQRRSRYGIPIALDDLPLAERYVEVVKGVGAKELVRSRWFNTITVQADSNQIAKIIKMPFVKSVRAVSKTRRLKESKPGSLQIRQKSYKRLANKYGYAKAQIEQLNGILLHDMGYDGRGMLVAVMDGGFQNVNEMPFFDSMRTEKRLVATHDFIDGDDFVFDHSNHGTNVFSTIAADLPGLMVGTAPKASYVLLKTEDVGSESLIEEDNWVAGAEYADSIGVDVINSSLGYSTFEYPGMSYQYADINGHRARITQGASRAAAKGLLIVNSAGNNGGDKWHYIGVPADADSILAVGAVDKFGERAYFSSFGPTADGRIKPNVAARGFETIVASLSGYVVDSASGTSFSSPVTAGMVASLWQATRNKTNIEVIAALQEASSQYAHPDDGLGYGVPDYYKAYYILSDAIIDASSDQETFLNTADELNIITRNPLFNPLNPDWYYIRMTDIFGHEVYSRDETATTELHRHHVQFWDKLPSGSYTIFIRRGRNTYNLQVMKSH